MNRVLALLLVGWGAWIQAQVPCDTTENCCTERCGNDLSCICRCLYEIGQALRLQEDYANAFDYLKAGQQMKITSRICPDLDFQAVMDSIVSEHRIWVKETGPGNKFAIADMFGRLVEKDRPYSPYRFSNPQPFRKGVAIFSEGDKYFFVNREGEMLTPPSGYDGVIYAAKGSFYVIRKGQFLSENSLTSEHGSNPAFWRHNETKRPFSIRELGPWTNLDAMLNFFVSTQNRYDLIEQFQEGLAWVQKEGKWGLIDSTGLEIIEPQYEFDAVRGFSDGLALVLKEGKWKFVDNTGRIVNLMRFNYASVRDFQNNGLARVERNGKWGFIDKAGNEVIPPKYDYARTFQDGLAMVLKNMKWGFIDEDGKEIVTPQFDSAEDFQNGMAMYQKDDEVGYIDRNGQKMTSAQIDALNESASASEEDGFLIMVYENGKWGFVDESGNVIVPAIYDEVWDFQDGVAAARKGDQWEFVDRTGRTVPLSQETYEYVGPFKNGFAKVLQLGQMGFINSTGRKIIDTKFLFALDFHEGLSKALQEGKILYIDTIGKKVDVPQLRYESAGLFFHNLARVQAGGRWGFIDRMGKEIVAPQYEDAGDFSDELARVQEDGKWGFINETGQVTIALRYEDAGDFTEGLAKVQEDDRWGFINRTGQKIISPKYEDAGDFVEGLARVQKEDRWGFIDNTGRQVITPQYENAGYSSEGLISVQEKGRWGFIERTGQQIVTPQYEDVRNFSGGLAKVQKAGKWGFIDKAGTEIILCHLDDSHLTAERKYLLYRSNKKGLLFADEKTYIPPEYEEIAQIHDEWVMVRRDNKWGWVDHRGNVMIPCRYDAATPFNEEGWATVLQYGLQFRINKNGEMIWRVEE